MTPFWAQPTSKLEFHSTEEQKIKEETMEESLGIGKKSYGTETDTETQSWFRLPILKPGLGRTQVCSCIIQQNGNVKKSQRFPPTATLIVQQIWGFFLIFQPRTFSP